MKCVPALLCHNCVQSGRECRQFSKHPKRVGDLTPSGFEDFMGDEVGFGLMQSSSDYILDLPYHSNRHVDSVASSSPLPAISKPQIGEIGETKLDDIKQPWGQTSSKSHLLGRSLDASPVSSSTTEFASMALKEDCDARLKGRAPQDFSDFMFKQGNEHEPQSPHESINSADCTDWDEDSMLDFNAHAIDDENDNITGEVCSRADIESRMTSSHKFLVGRLMNEFENMFRENTGTINQGFEGASSANAPSPSRFTLSSGSISSRSESSKRPRDDNDDDSDHNKRRRSKRGKAKCSPEASVTPLHRFACPYRKRNPCKYSYTNWRRCALTPHASVARVK